MTETEHHATCRICYERGWSAAAYAAFLSLQTEPEEEGESMTEDFRKAFIGDWPADERYESPIRPDRTLCSYCLKPLGNAPTHVLRHTKRREDVPVHIPCHAAILDAIDRYPHPRAFLDWLEREDLEVQHFNFMGEERRP